MDYVDESFSFIIKNIRDILYFPYEADTLGYSFLKLITVNKEFKKYHKITKGLSDRIQKAINQYDTASKTDNIIDIIEIERFFHKKLMAILSTKGKDKFYINSSAAILYAILWRYYNSDNIKDLTTYTALLPLPPHDQFVVLLDFDENNIYRVRSFASPNQYDMDSPIYLVDLKVQL